MTLFRKAKALATKLVPTLFIFANACSGGTLCEEPMRKEIRNEGTYEVASLLEKGACIQYPIREKTYHITLKDLVFSEQEELHYELIVYNGDHDSSYSLTTRKIVKLENDIAVSFGFGEDQKLSFFIHRIIPIEAVAVKGNCNAFRNEVACSRFLTEVTAIIAAIEKATGINLGLCFDTIDYRFLDTEFAQLPSGAATADFFASKGIIEVGQILQRKIENDSFLDSHEPLHLVFDCINAPQEDNIKHLLWLIAREQILRAYGDSAMADQYLESARQGNATAPKNDGKDGRCTEIKNFLLTEAYLALSDELRARFLLDFFSSINTDHSFLTSYQRMDSNAMRRVVCHLSNQANCEQTLATYCPD